MLVHPVDTVSRKVTSEWVPSGKPGGGVAGVRVEVGFGGVSELASAFEPVPVPLD